MTKLIKVLYFNSNDFDEGLLKELEIESGQLVAVEIYSDGTHKYVVIKNGVVDYILKGA